MSVCLLHIIICITKRKKIITATTTCMKELGTRRISTVIYLDKFFFNFTLLVVGIYFLEKKMFLIKYEISLKCFSFINNEQNCSLNYSVFDSHTFVVQLWQLIAWICNKTQRYS